MVEMCSQADICEQTPMINHFALFIHDFYFPFMFYRHASEMEILQKKMEELQRQYMKEKETLRVELVSTLLSARKMAQEQQETVQNQGLESELGLNPQLVQLQQQKQLIQQQIDEHIRQQQRVQQQQISFSQMQSGSERDLQQQRLMQQQLQQQMSVFSPPPTTPKYVPNSLSSSSPFQPVQPVPNRYAYVSAGGSQQSAPTFVSVNGQTVQVVGLPAHHSQLPTPQQLLPPQLQVAPVPPQQIFTASQLQPQLPEHQLLARPQSFAPAMRISPRSDPDHQEQDQDAANRIAASDHAQKRDSFSDSGQDSGHNTPTRGRTITEGLLRFVQDSSVARPQLRQASLEISNLPLQPSAAPLRPNPLPILESQLPLQTPGLQQQLQNLQLTQQKQATPPAGLPAGFVLQSQASNMYPHQQLQQIHPQPTPGYKVMTSAVNRIETQPSKGGRDSVPLLQHVPGAVAGNVPSVPAVPGSGRESVPLVMPQPVNSLPMAAVVAAGRESVPLQLTHGRDSVQSIQLGTIPAGRDSVQSIPMVIPHGRDNGPTAALAQLHHPGGRDSVQSGHSVPGLQAAHVPVIQAAAQPQQPSYPSVMPQSYIPGASYPTVSLNMATLPPQPHYATIPGQVKIGSSPPVIGAQPGYINIGGQLQYGQYPNQLPSQLHQLNQLQLQPGAGLPGQHAQVPGVYGSLHSGEVSTIKQPIMSTVSQPSQYLTHPHNIPVQTVPVMLQYQPLAGLAQAGYQQVPAAAVLPQSLTSSYHESSAGSINTAAQDDQVLSSSHFHLFLRLEIDLAHSLAI